MVGLSSFFHLIQCILDSMTWILQHAYSMVSESLPFPLSSLSWVQMHTLSLQQDPWMSPLFLSLFLGPSSLDNLQNRCVYVYVSLLTFLEQVFPFTFLKWIPSFLNDVGVPTCSTSHCLAPGSLMLCASPDLLHFMSLSSTLTICPTIPSFGTAPPTNFPIYPIFPT